MKRWLSLPVAIFLTIVLMTGCGKAEKPIVKETRISPKAIRADEKVPITFGKDTQPVTFGKEEEKAPAPTQKKPKSIIPASIAPVKITGKTASTTDFNTGKKLMRGLANVLTGWLELPKNIYEISVKDNIFSGLTIGLARGVGMTIVRTSAGVYELVTFPFPIPEDYEPVLEPEYVFGE